MDNPQELKKAILKTLAEKGDYTTILKHLSGEEKEEKEVKKTERLNQLIEPLSEFAELMTANTKGVFMENFDKKLSKSTRDALAELSKQVNGAIEALDTELRNTIGATKKELTSEHLARLAEANADLERKLTALAVEVVTAKASELLPELKESGKLTEEELQDIIEASALSVESQMSSIVGEYLAEQQLTASQIIDFADAVRKLLPAERQVTWDSIVGKPDISQGGTNYNQVKRMIDTALASFTGGGSVSDEAYGGTWDGVTDEAPSKNAVYDKIQSLVLDAGAGDVVGPVSATADNLAAFDGTTGKLIKDGGVSSASFATAAQGAKADSAVQSVVAGTNVTVDATDPLNPIVNASASANPAGADTQVQFNDGGIFGAVADFIYDKVLKRLKLIGGNDILQVEQTTNGVGVRFTNVNSASSGAGMAGYQDRGNFAQNNSRLGFFLFGGAYDNLNNLRNSVLVGGYATEDWDATKSGSKYGIEVTTNGTNSRNIVAEFDENGVRSTGVYSSLAGNTRIRTNSENSEIEIINGANGNVNLKPHGTGEAQVNGTRIATTADLHTEVTLDGAPNYLTIVGQVITRSLINLTSHVTGLLPLANLADGSALSVLGRSANSAGVQAPIAAGTDHHVLRRSGNSIGFGAINLAQANATTGSLPVNRGGTGAATHTSGNYLKGAGTSAFTSVPIATVKTELTLVKADVGLGNVDNTSDANKPVSTAQQTALDLKQTITDAYILTSEASSATPTVTGTALRNDYVATALAENATLAAPSGTANAGAVIRYRITASGGTRTIGYNGALLAGNVTRTTSLPAGETLTQIYQRVGSTWVCQYEDIN